MPLLSSGPIAIGVVVIIRAVLLDTLRWHEHTEVASPPQPFAGYLQQQRATCVQSHLEDVPETFLAYKAE